MKKIWHLLSIILTSIFLISSCSIGEITFSPYSYDEIDNDKYETIYGNNYYKLGNYGPLTYLNDKGIEEKLYSYQEMYTSNSYLKMMNTTGVSKLLVIPVDFSDYTYEKLNYSAYQSKAIIENAFFGKSSVTQFESVASYYDKSSYGKLKIEGKVSDWFRCSITYEKLLDSSTSKNIVLQIYNEAISWYKENYDDIESYRNNGDVPVYFIYSAPTINSADTVLWAYTYNSINLVSWTSFSSFNINRKSFPETHTIIHETGHLLGLYDYYSKSYSLTGGVDIMDYTLGDHTGFSKMCLNWVRPYAITGSTTITINDFESSGDLILINDNWNKTAMDEYLLLELYSPTKLNEKDSLNKYSEHLMNKTGIKIYHVDARASFFNSLNHRIDYISNGGHSKNNTRIGLSNTNSISSSSPYALYHLLEKSGNNSFIDGNLASNDTLFYEGDSFGVNTFIDFTFNNGNKLGYIISIDSIKNNQAIITISKK